MEYRSVTLDEMTIELFKDFERYQKVVECKRKIDGEWKIIEDPFIDDWVPKEYDELVRCLQRTIKTKGIVYGAFAEGKLKGFCSVESSPFGSRKQYLDLTAIHVSRDMRGHGVGRTLFGMAAKWAKSQGGKKLYISAHSAIESQRFYESMGCIEAEEYSQEHVEQEPCDCQMEFVL